MAAKPADAPASDCADAAQPRLLPATGALVPEATLAPLEAFAPLEVPDPLDPLELPLDPLELAGPVPTTVQPL
jgi:hypothetical protein